MPTLLWQGLVFHVRTELFVNSDSNEDFPLSSFKFTVPTQVVLRREGPGCEQIYCRPNNCFIEYSLQGYHEQLKWHETISFRKGTANEMGKYKCMEKAVPADPASALIFVQSQCPVGTTVTSFTEPKMQLLDANAKLRNDGTGSAGVVRFDVSQAEGTYHTTMVAVMLLPNGVRLNQVLDSKVQVAVMVLNDQPISYVPGMRDTNSFIDGSTPVDIVSGSFDAAAPSYPVKATPIEVQCGRSLFFLNKIGALNLDGPNLGTGIDFAFRDPDFSRTTGLCSQFAGQTIDFIDAANSLPRGLKVSNTAMFSGGVSKIELSWKPVCEDRSQVGLFHFCFYAKDKSTTPGFVPSYSVPSPSPSTWTIPGNNAEKQYHPTCLYVKSLPPAANPPPVLATDRLIHKVCCGKQKPIPDANGNMLPFTPCPEAGWADSNGIKVGNEYVLGGGGNKYEVVVGAQAENNFFKTDVEFFYPDATSVRFFSVSAPKYGCGASNFDVCSSNLNVQDTVARKLTVTIEASMPQNKIRICYQAFQTSPAGVDENAWTLLYRSTPTSKSCITCMILNIINAPVWPMEQRVDNSAPIFVGAGSTYVLPLTARNLGSGTTSIFILADPGAPDGSRLLEMQQTESVFVRNFEYTPTVAQAGLSSRVCFTASTVQEGAADPVDSDVLCYEFYVYVEQVSFDVNPSLCINLRFF